MRLFNQWIIIILMSQNGTASPLVSFLSQKTNEIYNLERCQEASLKENKSLAQSLPRCVIRPPENLSRSSYDQISEKLFFESAAQSQLKAYDCQISQVDQLAKEPFDFSTNEARQKIAADFAVKIMKLKELQKNLGDVEGQISEMERAAATSPMGETVQGVAIDPVQHQLLKKKENQLRSAIEMLQTSLWQGGNHLTKEYVQAEVKNKTFQPEKFIQNFIKPGAAGGLNSLIKKIRGEASSDKNGLSSKALKKSNPVSDFQLSDQDKIRLYKDKNWLVPNNLTKENIQSVQDLSCRLEGRYGKGRDRFYTSVQVVGTVALTVIPGGLYFAAGRGLIAMTAARTLSIVAATGASTISLATTYEQRCPESVMKNTFQGSCENSAKSFSEKLQHNNCALDVGLAALDIPFPELKALSAVALGLNVKSLGGKASAALGVAKQETKFITNPQLEIWRAREAGQIAEAKNAELAVQKILESGNIKVTGSVGEGITGAYFVEFENGVQGIWKPSIGKHADGNAEVAASKIDRYLGTDIVPVTVPRSVNGIEGTVQLKVVDLKNGAFEGFPYQLGYFDYLIGNIDRHGNNYLLTADGHMTAIDHGKSFYPTAQNAEISMLDDNLKRLESVRELKNRSEQELQAVKSKNSDITNAEYLKLQQKLERAQQTESRLQSQVLNLATSMTPSKEIVQKLQSTTREDWKKVVGLELTDQQIDQMVIRQKEVLGSISRSEQVLGQSIYPAGPVSPLIKVKKP